MHKTHNYCSEEKNLLVNHSFYIKAMGYILIFSRRYQILKFGDRYVYNALLNLCFRFFLKISSFRRDHWGDQDVDGRIILRWILRKWEGVVGTGWSCLRIGTGDGRL